MNDDALTVADLPRLIDEYNAMSDAPKKGRHWFDTVQRQQDEIRAIINAATAGIGGDRVKVAVGLRVVYMDRKPGGMFMPDSLDAVLLVQESRS